jgi:hypothetical protein
MKRTLALLVAFALLVLVAPVASAAPFAIDTGTSVLNFGVDLGLFFDDDDDPNTPDIYFPLVIADAQGDLPQGSLPVGDGNRNPGFSNGLSTQVAGTINANPGGFALTGGSTIDLLDSGEWQPGEYLGDDMNGDPIYGAAPVSSQLGIFLDANPAGFDLYLTGRLSDLALDITTDNLAVDGNGDWSDPNATLTLLGATLDGHATGPAAIGFGLSTIRAVLGAVNQTVALSGNFDGLNLQIPVDTEVFVPLEDQLGIPFFIRITVAGQINAVLVPEPSTIAMLGMGLVGVSLAVIRRRQK